MPVDATPDEGIAVLPTVAPDPTAAVAADLAGSNGSSGEPPILLIVLGLLALVGIAVGGLRAAGFELRRRTD